MARTSHHKHQKKVVQPAPQKSIVTILGENTKKIVTAIGDQVGNLEVAVFDSMLELFPRWTVSMKGREVLKSYEAGPEYGGKPAFELYDDLAPRKQQYKSYKDAHGLTRRGKWTIGWGHVVEDDDLPFYDKRKITIAEAEKLFVEDLQDKVHMVRKNVTYPLSQHQFDALVIFCYNTDPTKTFQRINAGKLDEALAKMGEYIGAHTKDKKMDKPGGLPDRRKKEALIWTKGIYLKQDDKMPPP